MSTTQMKTEQIYRASTTAPVNIAVVKYWGKRDASLNLPTNSSLSVTLSQSDLKTHTTASCSPTFKSPDTLLLNHYPQDISNPRTQACLKSLRALRRDLVESKDPSAPKLSEYPLRIVSENNFPTAAGLASSAAGFAALVRAVADLYQLPSSPEDLSKIARQGSGSACRSLFGGYVAWEAGSQDDGEDSLAVPVQPTSHWPGMKALILVASAKKKDVSSTAGMQATVATSALFSARIDKVVPERMNQMKEAIANRDFATFGELAMRDSNSFHATCADTWPPIFYMNDTSRAAVRLVEAINTAAGKVICAYTFDAGPNAVVFYEDTNSDFVEKAFRKVLGHIDGWKAGAGVVAPSEALPTPKKDAPSWLSRFSEALTIDAPNERDPHVPESEELTTASQQPLATPRRELSAPDWLRHAAEGLTREAPSFSTNDILAAVNNAANTVAASATNTANNVQSAAKSASSAEPKPSPAWLNKFAEALTAHAPNMREEGVEDGEFETNGNGKNDEVIKAEEVKGETGAPGWLNRFAAALTTGTGTAGPREEDEEVEEKEKAVEAVPAKVKEGDASTTVAATPAQSDNDKTTINGEKASVSATKEEENKEEKKTGLEAVVYDDRVVAALKEGVSRIIMTSVGEGPKSTRDHLIDEEGGVENRYSF